MHTSVSLWKRKFVCFFGHCWQQSWGFCQQNDACQIQSAVAAWCTVLSEIHESERYKKTIKSGDEYLNFQGDCNLVPQKYQIQTPRGRKLKEDGETTEMFWIFAACSVLLPFGKFRGQQLHTLEEPGTNWVELFSFGTTRCPSKYSWGHYRTDTISQLNFSDFNPEPSGI